MSEALAAYANAIAGAPDNPEAHRLYGVALLEAGRVPESLNHLQRAVALAPGDADALSNLAVALRRTVRLGDALIAASRAAALRPDDASIQFNLGNAAAEVGACADAEAAYRRSLALRPDHPGATIGLGHMLRALGRREEALAVYRSCLVLRGDWGDAWWSIANVKTAPISDSEVAAMRALLERDDLPSIDRAPIEYALGKALEDRGRFAEAFATYARGATIKRAEKIFDVVAHTAHVDGLISRLDASFFAARSGWGCRDEAPIFVVGLPRSGSTLVEQMLASHVDVEGAGELPYLGELAARLTLDALAALTPSRCEALGRLYLDLARAHRGGRPRFVDKMPNNFLHAGLIRLILPGAKIVDARRHPLDSCLGSFKQYFARGQCFSYDLDDLAAWYESYDRLMRHWAAVGLDVIRIDYELLVAAPERESKRLFGACGIDWRPGVLDFHKTPRSVLSASADQVRRPLYQTSVHAWRRFAHELQPLRHRLAPLIDAIPDGLCGQTFPKRGKQA